MDIKTLFHFCDTGSIQSNTPSSVLADYLAFILLGIMHWGKIDTLFKDQPQKPYPILQHIPSV